MRGTAMYCTCRLRCQVVLCPMATSGEARWYCGHELTVRIHGSHRHDCDSQQTQRTCTVSVACVEHRINNILLSVTHSLSLSLSHSNGAQCF